MPLKRSNGWRRRKGKKRNSSQNEVAARARAVANRAAKSAESKQIPFSAGANDNTENEPPPFRPVASNPIIERSARRHIRRAMIALVFVDNLCCPSPDQWHGRRTGTIAQVRTVFKRRFPAEKVPHQKTFQSAFEDFHEKIETGECIPLALSDKRRRNGGLNKLVKRDTGEEQLIADCMETGLSLTQTTAIVNEWRREKDATSIDFGRSSVYSAVLRLQPRVTQIEPRAQGNTDPTSDWSRARRNWVNQLLLRLRDESVLGWTDEYSVAVPDSWTEGDKLTVRTHWGDDEDIDAPAGTQAGANVTVQVPVPEHFQLANLPTLERTQIAFWDETHKEVQIGGSSKSQKQVQFKRDKNGKLDPNGEFRPRKQFLRMKYVVLLLLGCVGSAVHCKYACCGTDFVRSCACVCAHICAAGTKSKHVCAWALRLYSAL